MNTETPKSIKQQLQFQLDFMMLMFSCGRDDDAEKALKKICDLVDSLEA